MIKSLLRRFRAYEALLSHQTGKDVITNEKIILDIYFKIDIFMRFNITGVIKVFVDGKETKEYNRSIRCLS